MKALTTNQVAEVLNCNLQRVQILIRAGKLPAINIAVGDKKPRWRVPQSALDEFMNPTNRVARKSPSVRRRERIDSNVPKVFG